LHIDYALYILFSLREKVAESRMRVLSITSRLDFIVILPCIGENPHLSFGHPLPKGEEALKNIFVYL